MNAAPLRALAEVTQSIPARKTARGQVCALTRHPTQFAKAMTFLLGQGLTRRELHIMQAIVMRADVQGLYWGKCGDGGESGDVGELVVLTGFRPQTIRVTARKMRALGILEWTWIRAGKRYPRRDPAGYDQPALWGRGTRTEHGGRVWQVPWEKYGVSFARAGVSQGVGRLIRGDQSRLIPGDQSSDPSGSPSEIFKKDPAPAPPSLDELACSRELAPAADDRPPESETEKVATLKSRGEGGATPPLPPRLARNGRDREQGRGGSPAPDGDRGPARLSLDQMMADFARLYGPKRSPAP